MAFDLAISPQLVMAAALSQAFLMVLRAVLERWRASWPQRRDAG